MTKPLSKEELKKVKDKFAERNVYIVIDAQKNKNNDVIHEEAKIETPISESPELEHLSLKQENISDLLNILSAKDNKKKPAIKEKEIDWEKVKTI